MPQQWAAGQHGLGEQGLPGEQAGGPGIQQHCKTPEGEEAQLMAACSLTAWRSFTGSSKAQMPLLGLEKGRVSLKRMKADIVGSVFG